MIEIIGERKMDNVARSGHVPGAKLIEWNKISDGENKLSFRDADQLKAVFDHYGVTKDKTIYAYCHVGAGRSSEIITALQLLGYPNAKVFTGSWDTWGNDMNLPIKR
jgi:thiosulfate/3-mercaptopyruvate sulfurtransferase